MSDLAKLGESGLAPIAPAKDGRVSVTQRVMLGPRKWHVHEFHLRLHCRPLHLAIVSAELKGVQISRENDRGERQTLNFPLGFRETSVEEHEGRLRRDYDLLDEDGTKDTGDWDNPVVYVQVQSTLAERGELILHLIFQPT